MSRDDFELLLAELRTRYGDLAWRAWHAKVAPETTDVVLERGWVDGYVILTPYAPELWVDVNGATFASLDDSDAPAFFEALFAGDVVAAPGKGGTLDELVVRGQGREWTSGSA